MKYILKIFAVAVLMVTVATVPAFAADWNPFGNRQLCQGDAAQSAVCRDRNSATSNPLTGNDGFIFDIINILSLFAGIAAIIIIIIAALRMITSSGNSDSVAGSRRAIVYALVGLVVIVLARVIIGFVITVL